MKNIRIIILFLCALLIKTVLFAQPTTSQVQSHFKKGNVTRVDVKNSSREWDSRKSKYYWKVSLVKTETVDPAEVDGLKGVTKEVHVVADYDPGSISPYWSGVTYSEYKGINLPTPKKEELLDLVKKQGQSDPSKLVRSSSSKIGFDNYIVDEPNTEWINPKKIKFDAKIIYRERVNYTEVAVFESPVTVTLERTSMKSSWTFGYVYEAWENRKELSRSKEAPVNGMANVSISDQAVERNNKADIDRLKVPVPPKYTSIEALGNDLYTMLHNLTRDQYDYYLVMSLSPDLRCNGCVYSPNQSGSNLVNTVLQYAYDGDGKFRDQFCSSPNKPSVENEAFWFFNKKGSGESQVVTQKVGDYYYVTGFTLRVSKNKGENDALKLITNCKAN